jgi:tetratricopeptide (TPR) repeat protein
MNLSASRRTWEEASSPAAVRLARKYEQAWHGANGSGQEPGWLHEFLRQAGTELDGPGARLAIFRADIGLRWEAGDRVAAEWYVDHFPNLDDDTLVALIYEEFCLREEFQGRPDPAEYYARFPRVASALMRVIGIHELVGSATTASAFGLAADSQNGDALQAPFPEAGQTIAGFYLVEELGRGSFARVFLAKERQLADRLVALKVTRRGSREPQTLARLQHTHIVPVHSYRIDAATGHHLLCMPYFGRMTLARLLADPGVQEAESGTGLVLALDRLEPTENGASQASAGRAALGHRSYPRAIAWWGARLAEALDHAHERGVLHRDIKPSNVLVTAGGMPMLLDFNLACDPVLDDDKSGPAMLGGTLDYMSPEHLETLAGASSGKVDERADLYSLGIVLYEALVGRRPFRTPRKGISVLDVLVQAADDRSGAIPRLRKQQPEIPPALEAVVRHCLAPDPRDRYQSATELAVDLQAVADDRPLVHAGEPLLSKCADWLRRRRRPIALAAAVLFTIALAAAASLGETFSEMHRATQAEEEFKKGSEAEDAGDYAMAKVHYDNVDQLFKTHPKFDIARLFTGGSQVRSDFRRFWTIMIGREHMTDVAELRGLALNKSALAARRAEVAQDAQNVIEAGEELRFRFLIPQENDLVDASKELERVLDPFYVLKRPDWTDTDNVSVSLLPEPKQAELATEVNELLFLLVVAIDEQIAHARSEQSKTSSAIIARAIDYCERARVWARPPEPWMALKARLEERAAALERASPENKAESLPLRLLAEPSDPGPERSALASFQWGLLNYRDKNHLRAAEWLKRATYLKPGSYWYHFFLAYNEEKSGRADLALNDYSVALALRPDIPRIRFNRALLYRSRGLLDRAMVDLETAIDGLRDRKEGAQARLELGFIHQQLGDFARARAEYERLIQDGTSPDITSAARLNRAYIDAESGAVQEALEEYDRLVDEDPADASARFSRALLELRLGRARASETDLTKLLTPKDGREAEKRDEFLAARALARLELGRMDEAAEDASLAQKLAPSPAHERLRQRALLAAGRYDLLQMDSPDEIGLLPLGGRQLERTLQAAAAALDRIPVPSQEDRFRAFLTRAVILAALGKRTEALAVADRAAKASPYSPRVHLIRARILLFFHDVDRALADIERGLALQLDEPGLLHERGRAHMARSQAATAVDDFQEAITAGARGRVYIDLAHALNATGHPERALSQWENALRHDSESTEAFLGRARSHLQLRQWNLALVDLEHAAAWSHSDPALELRILWFYGACLAERPGRLPRWLMLATRTARDLGHAIVPPRS